MPRPIWKGQISFGLVNIPVTLYAAEQRTELHFHLLDNRNKARIHYARINDATGKEVPWNEIVKAYEYDKEHFVILKDEDFKKAAIESSQSIEIEAFVDLNKIDYIYFDKPYYLVPDKKGEKGYVLLREALKRTKKVGIAKVVIRTRQYLAALLVVEDALILDLLRFPNELAAAKQFNLPTQAFKTYKITPKELTIAEQLIDTMSADWQPEHYHDDYREALLKLIEKKEKGLPIEVKASPKKEAKVIDFMSLLKKSVADKKTNEKKTKSGKDTPSRKRRSR